MASFAASIDRWIQAGVGRPRRASNAAGLGRAGRLEDVEELEGHEAGRVRRMARDPHAAVGGLDRPAPRGAVVPEVGGGVAAAEGAERGRLAHTEVAVVERVEALDGQALEGCCQGREPDHLAGAPWPAVRPVDRRERRIRAHGREHDRGRRLDRRDEAVPGREPGPRQLDGRGENGFPRQTAEPCVRVAP